MGLIIAAEAFFELAQRSANKATVAAKSPSCGFKKTDHSGMLRDIQGGVEIRHAIHNPQKCEQVALSMFTTAHFWKPPCCITRESDKKQNTQVWLQQILDGLLCLNTLKTCLHEKRAIKRRVRPVRTKRPATKFAHGKGSKEVPVFGDSRLGIPVQVADWSAGVNTNPGLKRNLTLRAS